MALAHAHAAAPPGPSPAPPPARPLLQRACACGGAPGPDGECAACKARRLAGEGASSGAELAPPIVHDVLHSSGQALDDGVRSDMEGRFGHDFSRVRVHTDARAAESARAIDAVAYAVGHDVVFGSGAYAPESTAGRQLLAHELTHVLQQGASTGAGGELAIDPPGTHHEQEAEQTARSVASGESPSRATRAPQTIQRQARPTVQRRVVVGPPSEAASVVSDFTNICPTGSFSADPGGVVTGTCSSSSHGCDCLCDVTADAAREYSIAVAPETVSTSMQTLHDGSTAPVPEATPYPTTAVGPNPVTTLPLCTAAEFGAFSPAGAALWAPRWRILAHELCGHGRLSQTYAGSGGSRPGHDVTIDTENAIAAERGQPARGKFANRRQGESFMNPAGSRAKIAFKQTDGLHFEAP